MAEIHAMPGADLTAAQLLRVIASDEPRHVVVLAQGKDGAWHPSWTNMTIADLSFAVHVLQAKMLGEIR